MSEMTEQRGVLTETDAEPVTAATALDQVRAYLIRLKQIAAEENLAMSDLRAVFLAFLPSSDDEV